ncbi:hypothetical protein CKO35_10660 [Ectothiorhodospira shaposhnikovii]|uniref:hypothetical protein n=1 Tax=Ectothiorhodospira shaposhnikovii TaxID=1054 RepID=UPI001905F1BB|nr:hypothetical protein [Ectothiorhodospira shaposhnikovii]MBK1673760.1 hypothetical protein [Ectothiorhodospira shaposhnikovii]
MIRRWYNPGNARYYLVHLQQDLLGDWVLSTCWGGSTSKQGAVKSIPVSSQEAGLAEIERIARRRRQHGYLESP